MPLQVFLANNNLDVWLLRCLIIESLKYIMLAALPVIMLWSCRSFEQLNTDSKVFRTIHIHAGHGGPSMALLLQGTYLQDIVLYLDFHAVCLQYLQGLPLITSLGLRMLCMWLQVLCMHTVEGACVTAASSSLFCIVCITAMRSRSQWPFDLRNKIPWTRRQGPRVSKSQVGSLAQHSH